MNKAPNHFRFIRMIRLLIATAIGFAWACRVFAGGTITWPAPPLPPGANPATNPTPRLEWFGHFQNNLDQSKKMSAIDLIFDGDSITDYWMGKGRAIWEKHYGKLNPFDFGISGDKTENILWRLQNGQVDNLHPKLVAIMIGTNEIGLPPAQLAEGVKAVVDAYRSRCREAVILVQGIFPRGQSPTDPLRARVTAVNQLISQIADGKNVLYIDFGDKFLQPDGTISPEIMPDFLHPAAKGYEIWADAIQSIIDRYFPAPSPSK
jgi:beta-glucosidase